MYFEAIDRCVHSATSLRIVCLVSFVRWCPPLHDFGQLPEKVWYHLGQTSMAGRSHGPLSAQASQVACKQGIHGILPWCASGGCKCRSGQCCQLVLTSEESSESASIGLHGQSAGVESDLAGVQTWCRRVGNAESWKGASWVNSSKHPCLQF